MGIVVKVRIDGARETLAAFRKLPKEASAELRDANQKISEDMAEKIRTAARSSDAQSALVAQGIKARRDRVPTVQAGGKKRVGRNRKPLDKVLLGANFGARFLNQFRRQTGGFQGSEDYWFFSTVEREEPRIAKEWTDAADRVLSQWGRGG
ncbi:hypothetical protein [Kribbella italica]|uniref:HK97 gp10 family phage protein n=1 Tax=Kribbella italica TaxID=1540520 RepID=A0A7W9JA80_9ACTN|nr:hypothetical protein [Kribbella italica]MBB5837748.1 hypothetical protein [Kribbella italica]